MPLHDDATSVSRPGVLVVQTGVGIHAVDAGKQNAQELVEEGYVALAVDLFGGSSTYEGLPKMADESDPVKEQLLKDRFLAAYDLLQDHKLTEQGKIAAIGYSYGGGVVLRIVVPEN